MITIYQLPKEVRFNPVLDWTKHLIFGVCGVNKLEVEREEKFGGSITFENYNELETAYTEGKLHPQDLKKAVAESLIKILEPARKHFKSSKNKKLLEEIEKVTVTR